MFFTYHTTSGCTEISTLRTHPTTLPFHAFLCVSPRSRVVGLFFQIRGCPCSSLLRRVGRAQSTATATRSAVSPTKKGHQHTRPASMRSRCGTKRGQYCAEQEIRKSSTQFHSDRQVWAPYVVIQALGESSNGLLPWCLRQSCFKISGDQPGWRKLEPIQTTVPMQMTRKHGVTTTWTHSERTQSSRNNGT